MFLFMPLPYLVVTYGMVALGRWLDKMLFRTLGGHEFEPRNAEGRDMIR